MTRHRFSGRSPAGLPVRPTSVLLASALIAVAASAGLTGAVALSGNASGPMTRETGHALSPVEAAGNASTSAAAEKAQEETTQLLQTTRLKVISHNICGGCLPGNLEAGIDPTIAEIQSWNPHVVMLQEVCYEQYEYLAAELAPEFNVEFVPMMETGRCARGTPGEDIRGGQVLAARSPMTGRDEIDLGGDSYDTGGRYFSALCYDLTFTGFGTNEVKACVTHNRAFANVVGEPWHARGRWAHHGALASEMDDDLFGDGQIVVLGGDFNAEPELSTMDPIYQLNHDGDPTGVGEFVEADQDDATFFTGSCTTNCRTGQPTSHSGRKIDYIFFGSVQHEISGLSGGVIESTVADHNLYRGLADFTPYEPVTIADFEDAEDWENFWVRASGVGSPTNDGFVGTGLELTYDFTQSTLTRAVGAWAEGRALAIPGEPAYVTMQVNPEDGRGERPRMQFLDGDGEILTVQASAHLDSPGWQRLEYRIPRGTDYPLTFQRFYFQENSELESYESRLVVDELTTWGVP